MLTNPVDTKICGAGTAIIATNRNVLADAIGTKIPGTRIGVIAIDS